MGGFGPLPQVRGQFRELGGTLPHSGLIENLSQSKQVRRGGARSFGGQVSFGADKAGLFPQFRHQANVGELGNSADKDDVGGLDIAMAQPLVVQMAQGRRQFDAEAQNLLDRQVLSDLQNGSERACLVDRWVNLLSGGQIIRHLHNTVERIALGAAAHVQHLHQSGVGSRDWLKLAHALELAFVRALVRERRARHHFNRSKGAHHTASQPHFAVAATADQPEEFVVRNGRPFERSRRAWVAF